MCKIQNMIDISSIFLINHSPKQQWISLCGHLEAIVGKYYLLNSGNPDEYWYGIYYDGSINIDEEVLLVDKNLKGYVSCDNRLAFVLNDFIDKFKQDTKDYGIFYIGVDSLDSDCLQCKSYLENAERILPAIWIDDDFLNDDTIPFDFDKFELIDDGVDYLNPKHFSVINFISYIEFNNFISVKKL